MKIAIWDEPAALFMLPPAGTRSDAVTVLRGDRMTTRKRLASGEADVALYPTLEVYRAPDEFDVLPAVALSTWRFPYARVVLKHGLDRPVQRVAFDPRYTQEVLVLRIVLKEHYAAEPVFSPYPVDGPAGLLDTDDDAVLLVGPDVPDLSVPFPTLDLGQEWYELTNYPMVWGLFVTQRGNAAAPMVEQLRTAVRAAESERTAWRDRHPGDADLAAFYEDQVRLRFDDLAVASLTALQDYLFYYNVVDEVAPLPVFQLDEAAENGEPRPLV